VTAGGDQVLNIGLGRAEGGREVSRRHFDYFDALGSRCLAVEIKSKLFVERDDLQFSVG
jgi:hypothetical protein